MNIIENCANCDEKQCYECYILSGEEDKDRKKNNMTIYRTANLAILETYIIGGQINAIGNHVDDDHMFTVYRKENFYENNQCCLHKIAEGILQYIENQLYHDAEKDKLCEDPREYYGSYYRFKNPSPKNLLILAKRLKKQMIEMDKEDEEDNS